jgi:protein involved in polysaccharide export with SLBB domain
MLNSLTKFLFSIFAILSLVVTSACVPDSTAARGPQSYSAGQAAGATAQPAGEFRLGSGDRIRINVFGADQISGEYQVDLSGGLAVPLAGTIPAIGLTPKELGDRIAARLREQHMMENAQVSIEVLATRPFYILGEVEKPGEYPFHAGLNIVSAVATAGGFRYRADQNYVLIRRGGQDEEVRVPFASAAPIFPGDIVRVPGRIF